MKPATILTSLLFVAIPLNVLAQTSNQSGTGSQTQTQARPFPTTNYYRSPYARPPGYRPGEYAARAYQRQLQEEEERKHPNRGGQASQNSRSSQERQAVQAVRQYLDIPAKNDKNAGYTYQDTITVDDVKRTFQCHVPPGYKTLKNMPLVLCFHGLSLNGRLMMFISQFNPVADRNGFVVVYGDGIGNAWDDGRGGRGIDDVGYVCKVIDKVAATVSVDKRRVYACGISNGGYFSQLLACAIPDRLAGIGVVASTLTQQAANHCHSSRPMPIMFFLGTGDPLVAWGSAGSGTTSGELSELVDMVGASKIGGVESALARYGGLLPVPEVVDFWTAHNRCPTTNPYVTNLPDKDPKDGTRVRREAYGSSGSEVVIYRIESGGHTWPGGLPYSSTGFAGKISQDIDASDTLWQFFKTHSR